ncbi:zinc finger protein 667 isoform X5 [Rhinolophus sinicus]|uniref:zinc finger protein 667 isoform X5 n=1 Tax=Rhinolophus sinicus TaxID=89399 RepID=UPI003D78CC2F
MEWKSQAVYLCEPSVILGASSIGCGPSRTLKRGGDAPEDIVSDLPPCVRMHGYVQASPPQHAAPPQMQTLIREEKMPPAQGKSKPKVS